jgi:ferritin
MISKKMQGRLNKAIQLEFESSYLYLSMAAWCESTGLDGFAKWMEAQSGEERSHGMKVFKYLNDQQSRVKLPAVGEPKQDWPSIVEVFEESLAHEKKVTAAYNDLMTFAGEEKDHATQSFLTWFVDEQIEEERTAAGILEKLKLVSASPSGILLLDSHVSKRSFSPAAAQ